MPRIPIKPRRVRPAAYALFSATPTCACTKPYRISLCPILRALPFTLRNTGRRCLSRGSCVFRSRSKRARCRQVAVFRASLPPLRPFRLLRLQHRFRRKRDSLFRFRRRVREANRSPLQPTAAFRIRHGFLPDRARVFFIGKKEVFPRRRICATHCRTRLSRAFSLPGQVFSSKTTRHRGFPKSHFLNRLDIPLSLCKHSFRRRISLRSLPRVFITSRRENCAVHTAAKTHSHSETVRCSYPLSQPTDGAS